MLRVNCKLINSRLRGCLQSTASTRCVIFIIEVQFFNCRKEAWKWFDGIQTDACQIFFRALLKSKLLQRSFRWEYLKSQWDFRVKIGRLPEAREIMNDQVLLDFSSLLHAYDFSPNCTPLSSITIMYLFYRMTWEFQTNCRRAKKRLTITGCYLHCHKIAIDYQQTDFKYFCLHLTHCNRDFFTLYTLISVSIFSILSPIHPLRSWQGEFV